MMLITSSPSISSLKSISVIRYDQARFFIEAIRQDKLRIRKTHDPNHAKFYIFKIKDEIANLNSIRSFHWWVS